MIEKMVFATMAYYDALDYPLTEFELWKHLLVSEREPAPETVSLAAVLRAVAGLEHLGRLERRGGMLTLPGRTLLIPQRIDQERLAVVKLHRATRLVRFCAWVPFVRMIAFTGSLSLKAGDRDSDWDFFVVLRGGAIWTGRLLLTAWLALLGRWRHGQVVRDRACLNCYVADSHLEVPLRDLFSSHEYRFLYPVVGLDTFRRFELANRWMHEYRPNFAATELPTLFFSSLPSWVGRLQAGLERLIPLGLLEARLASWQSRRIAKNPKTQIPGGFIEASDQALIFLPHPKGPKVFERFKERLSKV